MEFAAFMATGIGRVVRIVAGLALILVGLLVVGGTVGWIITIVGVAPLLAGLMNVCLIAPLIGAPFSGQDARRHASR
jgi:hypothetical protein